jgi:hypothetical protein
MSDIFPPPGNEPRGVARAPTETADLHAQFDCMCNAFAHHGGLVQADDIVRSMRGRIEQPISALARQMVSREVITVEWRSKMLVPMFQFDENSMDPTSACREIFTELSDVMDDWTIALWFATCNPLLDGMPPVDVLTPCWNKALQAARVTRRARAPRGGYSPRR